MKKFYTLAAAILVTMATVFAQSPDKISYQAVVRNNNDALLVNAQVRIKLSILQGSIYGKSVYVETHSIMTNENGLVSIEIGGGRVVSGNFSTIDWSLGSFFIKTEIDPTGGTNYTIVGTSQLLSVPYALYAKTSGTSTPGPKGDKGDQGEQGVAGPKGDKGDKGDQGEQGVAGPKGDKGDKGDQGEQGVAGPKGDKGDKGDQGEQGIAGPKGDKGDKGEQGEQGVAGPKGDKGDQGEQGIAGPKGDKGDKGDQGEQGIAGPKGDKGDKGDQGEQGVAGPKGDKGDKGDQGEQGVAGPKGDKGDQGEQGVAGPKGDKGDKGDQGEQGVAGPKGDKGDQGDPGVAIDDTQVLTDKTWSSDKINTELSDKVTKVSGKGLSTEDYTTEEKNKLAAISGVNTGDQDISGIAINAAAILELQAEQIIQNAAIALNTAKVSNATHTGDVTGSDVLTIGDGKVTDAKIADMSATKLTGTVAIANGGTGASTKAAAFNALSPMTAAGDIIYGGTDGTGTALAKGTAGQVLTMNAGATAPEWKDPSVPTNTVVTKATNYTATSSDKYIICTAALTITLPTAIGKSGTEYIIKNISNALVTVVANGAEVIIQDSANQTNSVNLGIEAQNNWIKVVSDGANWICFRSLY